MLILAVRLSINHEESSEGSNVSSKVSGMQKRRKKKTDGTKSNSTENRNESHGYAT